MSYTLQKIIPNFNITVKENIPALTGTVISIKYYLSLEDYYNINIAINGIIDLLNVLIQKSDTGLYDLTSPQTLSTSINDVITSQFKCIQTLNNASITTDTQNIKTLGEFRINGIYYGRKLGEDGVVQVQGNFISGKPEDFVQTFNGKTGYVTGISSITMNSLTPLPVDNGVVALTGLTKKQGYITRINGSNEAFANISNLLSTTQVGNRFYLPVNETDGLAWINDYVLIGETTTNGKVLMVSQIPLTLKNVDFNSVYSAVPLSCINKVYNQDLIITGLVADNEFILPTNYYPLHFYNSAGNWLPNVTWQKINNKISTNLPSAIYTAMKVDEK